MGNAIDYEIGQRVKAAREEMRMSQEEAARIVSIGRANFGHYERGRSPWTAAMLFALARVLNKPVEHFLGLSTDLIDEERDWLHLFRNVKNPVSRKRLMNAVKILAGEEE